jgi:hypothetical protein
MDGPDDAATYDRLDALPDAARRRLSGDDARSAFHLADWFAVLAESCATAQHRPFILATADAGLVAPLVRRLDRSGRHLESWTNFYSCDFTPLRGALPDPDQARRLAAALARQRPRIDTLHLRDMRADTVDAAALGAALRAAGWWTQLYEHNVNRYESVAGIGYDDFMATRDGGLRATIRRKARRFAALPGADLQLATQGTALETALAAYLTLHARSWKPPEPFPGFVRAFVHGLARRGLVRIGVATARGRPVAAQIWIVWQRRATIAKLAHDEAERDLSPGSVLTAWMIREALDAGTLDEIDFGRGDDPYKRLWLPRRRPMMALLAGNARTPRGAGAALRHLGPQAVRRAAQGLHALFALR